MCSLSDGCGVGDIWRVYFGLCEKYDLYEKCDYIRHLSKKFKIYIVSF